MIHHLVYSSVAVEPFTDPELVQLLQVARAKNSSLGVTGLLLHRRGAFMQLLEGDENAVQTLYRHISKDPRHGQVVTLLYAPAAERLFPDWSMAFQALGGDDLSSVEGFNPSPHLPLGDDYLPWKTSVAMRLLAGFLNKG